MIRFFDIFFAIIGLVVLSPLSILILVGSYLDTKSPIFSQTRVGRNKTPFTLIKFRTMRVNTESVASHLAPPSSVTSFGRILRKTKLDELPQLLNVLIGDMSLVGPRPNLFNQTELMKERDDLGIYEFRPGITGKAQILNIDMSTPQKLAKLDKELVDELTIGTYFKYIFLTALGKGAGDAIKQK